MNNFLDGNNQETTSSLGIIPNENEKKKFDDTLGLTPPSKVVEKEVKIHYHPDVPNEKQLTEVQASNLKKILRKAGEYNVQINSTKRDAQSQAKEMYHNHVVKQRKNMGYGSAGRAVLAVLDKMIAADKKGDKTTKEQKIEVMEEKIKSFPPSTFDTQMTHLSDFTRVITVDIEKTRINNPANFKKVLREYDKSVLQKAKLPEEGGEPAYHLEIKF